jgi:hypothetical protein
MITRIAMNQKDKGNKQIISLGANKANKDKGIFIKIHCRAYNDKS